MVKFREMKQEDEIAVWDVVNKTFNEFITNYRWNTLHTDGFRFTKVN